jgi:hypothetical protein
MVTVSKSSLSSTGRESLKLSAHVFRKRLEEAESLNASQNLLRRMSEYSPIVDFVRTTREKIIGCRESCSRIKPVDRDELALVSNCLMLLDKLLRDLESTLSIRWATKRKAER